MRLCGIFIIACVVLAAAQAIAAILLVVIMLGVAYCLFVHPRETIGLVALSGLIGLFSRQPLACLALAAVILLAGALRTR